MSTIADKLEIISDSLSAIKTAIMNKGQTPSGDITTYATAINSIDEVSSEISHLILEINGEDQDLNYLKETKELMRQAIISKGIGIEDTATFRSYVEAIESIIAETAAEGISIEELESIDESSDPKLYVVTEEGTRVTSIQTASTDFLEDTSSADANTLYLIGESTTSGGVSKVVPTTQAEYESLADVEEGALYVIAE